MARTLLLATALLVAAASPAAGVEAVADPAAVPVGSRGVCVTEMDGGEIVRVPVTILGELGPATPEGELIVVRLDGPRFAETGIIAGMSGSPVYVGDRLLGALAYGWQFAKEPIGGVTPFTRMAGLAAAEPAAAAAMTAGRPDVATLMAALADGSLGARLVDWLLPQPAGDGMTRLPLALATGAPLPPAGGWLARSWRRLGWVSGAAAGRAPGGGEAPLVPGAMLAGVMVDGDATLAVGGTVTEVRGDEVWAFGHPFLGAGGMRLPMARAHTLAVLPSVASSFKMFTVGSPLGALTVDRGHGVWGRVGEAGDTLPMTVRAGGRDYHYRVVNHPVLLPLLAGYLTYASHAVHGRVFGEETIALRVTVHFDDGEAVTVGAGLAGGTAATQAAAFTAAVLGYLEASPFTPPPATGVEVTLEPYEGLEEATIVDAVPRRQVVRPGDELAVRVRLQTHRAGEVSRWVHVQVPAFLPDGRVDLVVADGAAWTSYDLAKRPAPPASFGDELALLGRVVPADRLVVVLEDADSGVTLPGGTVWTPPSVTLALAAGLAGNLDAAGYRVVAQQTVAMPYPLSGAVRVPLRVRREGAAGEEEP